MESVGECGVTTVTMIEHAMLQNYAVDSRIWSVV